MPGVLTRDEHDCVVGALYSAAAGQQGWRSVLGPIADRLRHQSGVLVVADRDSAQFQAETHGADDDFANRYYASDTFRDDPRTPHFFAVPAGAVYFDRALYDVSAMLRDERVRHTVATIGVCYQLGVSLRLSAGRTGMFTLLSTEAEGEASEGAVEAIRRLAPHIEQAVALGELLARFAVTQDALLEAMTAKADGVILLDIDGTVSFANPAAEAILAAGEGLCWEGRRIAARRGPENRRLQQLIRSAMAQTERPGAERPGGQTLVGRGPGARPLVVRVLPTPPSAGCLAAMSCQCALQIYALNPAPAPQARLLADLFGLSPREADLVLALVSAATLVDAAAAAGMSHNTARNHLQRVFLKCGTRSQAETLALIAAMPRV